jgi:hypothetical protein
MNTNKSYLGADRESPMTALQRGNPQFELYPELDVRTNDNATSSNEGTALSLERLGASSLRQSFRLHLISA